MPIRPLDELPRTADLVIIGGGVVGAATAFAARETGLRTVIVERRPALAAFTTAAAAGGFRLQLDDEEELALISETVELLLSFNDATRQDEFDPDVRQRGYLWLTTSEEGAERQRRLVDLQRSWGVDGVELLSADEARGRWPWIDPTVVQARFRQADGTLEPRQAALGLALGSGAEAAVSCTVTGFRVDDGRLHAVLTDRGQISCGAVVVAAGPFAGALAGLAGVDLPIRTVVRHKVVVADEPAIPAEAPMTIDDDTGAHWRPAFGGASILFTDPSTPATPPADPVVADPAFPFAVLEPSSPTSVARVVPFWRDIWERGPTWFVQAGQYTLTPDGRPLIGATPVEGLFMNAACDGRGVMRSAATGRIAIDVVTGRVSADRNRYRLDREFVERPRLDAL